MVSAAIAREPDVHDTRLPRPAQPVHRFRHLVIESRDGLPRRRGLVTGRGGDEDASVTCPRVVVFDIGGVLVDFDYRRPCRTLFSCDADVEHFLTDVLGDAYHLERDRGIPMAETAARWCQRHPEFSDQIRSFTQRLPEM